ncbi:MAG: hypothetical protein HAW66_07645 [Shewanella sp.]|nr:hypothetical protein [Shewanella sp.]
MNRNISILLAFVCISLSSCNKSENTTDDATILISLQTTSIDVNLAGCISDDSGSDAFKNQTVNFPVANQEKMPNTILYSYSYDYINSSWLEYSGERQLELGALQSEVIIKVASSNDKELPVGSYSFTCNNKYVSFI